MTGTAFVEVGTKLCPEIPRWLVPRIFEPSVPQIAEQTSALSNNAFHLPVRLAFARPPSGEYARSTHLRDSRKARRLWATLIESGPGGQDE